MKWINLGVVSSSEYETRMLLFDQLSDRHIPPAKNTSDAFGDLRSLVQNGFIGGESWDCWSPFFLTEYQQKQVMAYLGEYFGVPIVSMDQVRFEFELHSFKVLHQKMEEAGLHKRFDKPDRNLPVPGIVHQATRWGLERLTSEQIISWEKQNKRTLPNALKRIYTSLFGGGCFFNEGFLESTYLLSQPTGTYPNLLTLDVFLKKEGIKNIEHLFVKIQHGLNQLQHSSQPQTKDTITTVPNLRNALVLGRHFVSNMMLDVIEILIDFGPLKHHMVSINNVVLEPDDILVYNEGRIEPWLIKTYTDAWYDLN